MTGKDDKPRPVQIPDTEISTDPLAPVPTRLESELPCIIVIAGDSEGTVVPIPNGRWIIGRDPTALLSLSDQGVSRQHAAIELAEGEFATLYDLGSTNGTSVNGRTIKQAGIREGDLIQLGTSVTLRFGLRSRHELGGTAPLPAPIPAPVPPPAASDLQLSRRELEVARLASTGLNNDEIAKRLFISPKTVKTHLRNIYQRLDLHSKVELTRYLLQHGALEPHDDE